jgi:uncharacterized protein (TIGR00730 family)
MMAQTICVFSSSSDAVAPAYFQAARELGALIALRGHTLVYGGASTGLMGELARAVQAQRGKVIGVIPENIRARGVAYSPANELHVTADLRERKAMMETRSDAFIALPGGFGTLEEVSEVLTLKQLQVHSKPIIFINILGFYDKLLALYDHFYAEHFAKEQFRVYYTVVPDAASALVHLEDYRPPVSENKWY